MLPVSWSRIPGHNNSELRIRKVIVIARLVLIVTIHILISEKFDCLLLYFVILVYEVIVSKIRIISTYLSFVLAVIIPPSHFPISLGRLAQIVTIPPC